MKDKIFCQNDECGREVFGFWKYGINKVCSLRCLRKLIFIGKISKLLPNQGYPELDISPSNKHKISIERNK